MRKRARLAKSNAAVGEGSHVPGEDVVGDPGLESMVEVLDRSRVAKCDHETFESSSDLGFEIVIFISGFSSQIAGCKVVITNFFFSSFLAGECYATKSRLSTSLFSSTKKFYSAPERRGQRRILELSC